MFLDLDLNVARALNSFLHNTNGAFTSLFKGITFLAEKGWFFFFVSFILCLFKKTRRKGIICLLSIIISCVFMYLLKNIVRRPRPFIDETSEYYKFWVEAGKVYESSYSFPSGHTTIASAFGVALFLTSNKKYSYVYFLIPVLIGITRIYFNVHYFSDVCAAAFLSALLAIITYFIYNYVIKKYYITEKCEEDNA